MGAGCYFYSYLCSTDFGGDVEKHTALLRCRPWCSASQRLLRDIVTIAPGYWQREGVDSFGNRVLLTGRHDAHCTLVYEASGIVELSDVPEKDVRPVGVYRVPSKLADMGTAASPELALLTTPMHLCHYVNSHMTYRAGSTTALTTASEAWEQGTGVCQDFAHVMIGFCRAKGWSARYVAGLLEGEGATHAWVEVWQDGVWCRYDPTHAGIDTGGYIKIAHGRDALDCQMSRGVYCRQKSLTAVPERTIVRALVQRV